MRSPMPAGHRRRLPGSLRTPRMIARCRRFPKPAALTPREKAAVIVRYLLAEGTPLPLSALPEHMQAALAEQMGQMRLVDRTTLDEVVEEFLTELESGRPGLPRRDRRRAVDDGWPYLAIRRPAPAPHGRRPRPRSTRGTGSSPLPADRLLPVLEEESARGRRPSCCRNCRSPRRPSFWASCPATGPAAWPMPSRMTGNVDPETVRRIGAALLAGNWTTSRPRAFDTGPGGTGRRDPERLARR